MKRLVMAVLLPLIAVSAQSEESCPADRAAAAGFAPFEAFHHAMAPTWHLAWPEKDYDALLAAGPKFVELFIDIEQLKPTLKSKARLESFEKARAGFAAMVSKYSEACQQNDSALVYQLMPELHDAFEISAATLLPVSYPEFEGLVITLDLVIEVHLPADNVEGLVGSTETMVAKMETLIEASLPDEIKDQEDAIKPRLEMMRQLVLHMLQALYQSDIKEYIIYATELKTQTNEFAALFI